MKAPGILFWRDMTPDIAATFNPEEMKNYEGMTSFHLIFVCNKCSQEHLILKLSHDPAHNNGLVTFCDGPFNGVIMDSFNVDLPVLKTSSIELFSYLTGYTFELREDPNNVRPNTLSTLH